MKGNGSSQYLKSLPAHLTEAVSLMKRSLPYQLINRRQRRHQSNGPLFHRCVCQAAVLQLLITFGAYVPLQKTYKHRHRLAGYRTPMEWVPSETADKHLTSPAAEPPSYFPCQKAPLCSNNSTHIMTNIRYPQPS